LRRTGHAHLDISLSGIISFLYGRGSRITARRRFQPGLPLQLQYRDWRQGDTCFVEDLRVTSGHAPPHSAPGYVPAAGECRNIPRTQIRKPNIEISRERPGNEWNDRIKVQGTVEGQCLTEAGYYEDGRKVESIPLVTSGDFQRFDFDIKARGGRDPEIRVYNVHGDRDIHYVDEDYARGRFDEENFDDTEYFDPLGGIFGR
jgi:hypothetical protein